MEKTTLIKDLGDVQAGHVIEFTEKTDQEITSVTCSCGSCTKFEQKGNQEVLFKFTPDKPTNKALTQGINYRVINKNCTITLKDKSQLIIQIKARSFNKV
jgi:hypothetical protein